MGSIIQNAANNFTTNGVITASGVNNTSVSAVTSLPSGLGGSLTLISSQTASASASISFTSGIDSTYDEYIFKFINIHPSVNDTDITFQGSTNGGSSYGITLTSTNFQAVHFESDSTGLSYENVYDLAQSTSYQILNHSIGTDNDQSASGTLHLFNPSSTTYVKHFIYRGSCYHAADLEVDAYIAGYFNTTSAINAVDFKMSSGNIDDGIIKMYGLVKS